GLDRDGEDAAVSAGVLVVRRNGARVVVGIVVDITGAGGGVCAIKVNGQGAIADIAEGPLAKVGAGIEELDEQVLIELGNGIVVDRNINVLAGHARSERKGTGDTGEVHGAGGEPSHVVGRGIVGAGLEGDFGVRPV